MADINYTVDDLVNTRFVISPMSTATYSANIAFNAPDYPLYSKWSQYVAEKLDGIALPTLNDFHHGTSCIPEFLNPFPTQASRTFEEELQLVATMTEDHIEAELVDLADHYPPFIPLAQYTRNPRALRNQLVDEMHIYWRRVMQPHWSHIRSLLETDIVHRSRLMATQGHTEMFTQLSPNIDVEHNRLSIHTTSFDVTVELAGDGIILEPNIFASRMRLGMSQINPGILLSYPAPGAGNWRSQATATPSEALSMIVGENRAQLLYRLIEPITTSQLAADLHLTPGAVSQQLGQLYEAGLAEKQRLGKHVFYNLTARGNQLLDVFETVE